MHGRLAGHGVECGAAVCVLATTTASYRALAGCVDGVADGALCDAVVQGVG